MKSFKQYCLIIHELLNQGEIAAHCSFIGTNNADFNLHSLSNPRRLFSETISPKNHCQVSYDKIGYQDSALVSFTEILPEITTDNNTREWIYSPSSIKEKGFATKLHS